MSNIVIIGFTTEGTTDVRFLGSIISRTFEEVAFECNSSLEIHSVQHIPTEKTNFVNEVLEAARKATEIGVMVLCVHADADNRTDTNVINNKILPSFQTVQKSHEKLCKNLVAIVPVQMTEAWMLADPELLKESIGTNKSIEDLKLQRRPQDIADPKQVIKDAIAIAFEDQTRRKRKRNVEIGELYLPIGQTIDFNKLSELSSYQNFRNAVRSAYVSLGYLH